MTVVHYVHVRYIHVTPLKAPHYVPFFMPL